MPPSAGSRARTAPIIGQQDRAELLLALECVDAVMVFDEDTPEAAWTARPDIWVKGGDYKAPAARSRAGGELGRALPHRALPPGPVHHAPRRCPGQGQLTTRHQPTTCANRKEHHELSESHLPDRYRPGRVLVTGGASGLGAAVVDAVLKAGGTPVVLDRDISSVSGGEGLRGGRLRTAQRWNAAVREAAESLGGLDAVVTAAGIDRCGKLADVAADEWEKVIGVNLLGTVSVVRAALPYLKASRGRVVTVASTLGKRAVAEPQPTAPPSSAWSASATPWRRRPAGRSA